jgi:hypothetical protein
VKAFYIGCGIAAVLVFVLAYVFGGQKGLFGMFLGLGSTAFNIVSFRFALWVVGRTVKETKKTDSASIFGVMALFVKLPVWCLCAMIAQKAGGVVLNCFLLGLGLVYCAAIGWALAKNC